jgi:uncharacterized damage-inducible protein DinB
MSEKEMFLQVWNREFPTTIKVLKAFPADKADWKPHEKSKTAISLAWGFPAEQYMFVNGVLTGTVDFKTPMEMPVTMAEIISTYEQWNADLLAKLSSVSDEDLQQMVPFFTAPKTMGQIRKADLLWMMLFDSIHHRGQFSVYLRMAGGAVPSIYGPSADEPWQ